MPSDRERRFEPLIIGKHERRFTGFDQKIIAMYARGMAVLEMYGSEVSPDFISKETDEVMAEVTAWQYQRWQDTISAGVEVSDESVRRALQRSLHQACELIQPASSTKNLTRPG